MEPSSTPEEPEDPIVSLLQTYNELNSPLIEELYEVPSALEFMRYVALNRPFVVRGGAQDWEATKSWDVGTLKKLLEGQSVNVAVTPEGYVLEKLRYWEDEGWTDMGDRNADSPTRNEDGELLFVKPWEEQQPFNEFVDFVAKQEKEGRNDLEVRYAQTRVFHVIHSLTPSFSNFHSSFSFEKITDQNTENDNLRNEYSTLFSHVEKDISWARIALRQQPEAINLWIGNSRSVTALHKDNYENIYVQVIGQKHFVLLPPLAYPCITEKELPPASYIRSSNSNLEIQKEDGDKVPFATWDPDSKEDGNEEKEYERFARPVRVTLEKGDMLYLPAMWYHKVSQSCSEEGICCAANYWLVVYTALRGSLLII